jgi:hypothetical protein
VSPFPAQQSFDLFDTASMRAAVLDTWRSSPTRFREDANAEEDLRLGGYSDRLAVELAANASDAALAAGVPGTFRVSTVETADGVQLSVANTGAPLDSAGVAALASLRASAKLSGQTVGRFGVGFAAVLAVTDEPSVRSRNGGVRFSLRDTLAEIGEAGELAEIVRSRNGTAPVLRLPWPESTEAEPGYPTEVRLPLRSDVDGAALLAGFAEQAADLLLALPGLARIEVGEQAWRREDRGDGRVAVHGPSGVSNWLLHRTTGEFTEEQLHGLGVEARASGGFWTCWAAPVEESGEVAEAGTDVLHAPTPTDERLSLPARLLATVPVETTRRRVQRGPAVDAVLDSAAAAYPGLLAAVTPGQRLRLVPLPGFPLSEVDGRLREGVLAALAEARWLPCADGREIAPTEAVVLEGASADLVELLAGVLPGLLASAVSGQESAKALAAAGVRRLGLGEVVDALAGIGREPSWWARLYAALAPLADVDRAAVEELGGLPVPLADGRTVTGPRTVLLPSADLADVLSRLDSIDIVGLRVAHPDAVHPLLERLGATYGDAVDLLDAPELETAVARSVSDAAAGADPAELADLVLRLVEQSGYRPGERSWLGALALPDSDGEVRRADELVLPDSPLLDVLDPAEVGADGSLGVLAGSVADSWPRETLAACGVLESFSLVVDESPTAPEHGLPDEERWWNEFDEPPVRLAGIRELDLVADDAWPVALRLLAGSPETWRAITAADGHPAWWLARYALLGGQPPRHWRMPGASGLAGLYDEVPDLGLPEQLPAAIGVRTELAVTDTEEAGALLERLADPAREVLPGVALRAHSALAAAVADGLVDAAEVDPPERVRALSGAAVAAGEVLVLDVPWLLGVLDPDEVVACVELADAPSLAELLDVPLGAEEFTGAPADAGEPVPWGELGAVAAAADLLGVAVPDGVVALHDELRVSGQPVRWWVDADGMVHAEDSPDGLGRALAWTMDHWDDRHRLTALLSDPDTFLS